eukprot:scaffold50767_cov17-Prasinocladus_malaysianus.AAC.1
MPRRMHGTADGRLYYECVKPPTACVNASCHGSNGSEKVVINQNTLLVRARISFVAGGGRVACTSTGTHSSTPQYGQIDQSNYR